MAILTPEELVPVRQELAADVSNVTWTRGQIDAWQQITEDWLIANLPSLMVALDVSGPPLTLPVKRKIAKACFKQIVKRIT